MIATVQIRIIAETREQADAAITALRRHIGTAHVSITAPRQGRKGDEYLAYGTFQCEVPEETATAPATGPTQRLAATGPTQRLYKRRKQP